MKLFKTIIIYNMKYFSRTISIQYFQCPKDGAVTKRTNYEDSKMSASVSLLSLSPSFTLTAVHTRAY